MVFDESAGVPSPLNTPTLLLDFDGDDLVILARSGDERAQSAHNGNLITFHRVRNFRGLVY
uniref:hypothetical protein n=1 Tax=Horticoccus sp. 23ND18S-11 TaxID=3391832 RepID=UPI0039C9BDC2